MAKRPLREACWKRRMKGPGLVFVGERGRVGMRGWQRLGPEQPRQGCACPAPRTKEHEAREAPAKPANPAKPATPANPANPTKPWQILANPSKASKPWQSQQTLANPDKPSKHSKRSKPQQTSANPASPACPHSLPSAPEHRNQGMRCSPCRLLQRRSRAVPLPSLTPSLGPPWAPQMSHRSRAGSQGLPGLGAGGVGALRPHLSPTACSGQASPPPKAQGSASTQTHCLPL